MRDVATRYGTVTEIDPEEVLPGDKVHVLSGQSWTVRGVVEDVSPPASLIKFGGSLGWVTVPSGAKIQLKSRAPVPTPEERLVVAMSSAYVSPSSLDVRAKSLQLALTRAGLRLVPAE